MTEWDWVVCLGCGKTGWLDLDKPMNQTGWYHKYVLNSKDESVNFYLCESCHCLNCPEAIITTGYDEDGSPYPDIECLNEEQCKYLQGSTSTVKKVDGE